MTTTKQYDYLNRLTSIGSANASAVVLDSHGYAYNPANQRTSGTNADGSYWVYQYDSLGQVTSGVKYWADGSVVAGNLQTLRYGNGVTNLYQYDARNRLTNLVWRFNASPLASFAYQLGVTGNRVAAGENVNGVGRGYVWNYDLLYRLTGETIGGMGSVGYGYDAVGNRLNRQSTIAQLPATTSSYNANDLLASDGYDHNGNTTASGANGYQYDALNHLVNVNNGQILLGYDGDGNRVSKQAGGTTTYYLVDDRNPSGYAQVVEEWTSTGTPALAKVYNYGLVLISQRGLNGAALNFGADGHGSTRLLLSASGAVVNTFASDAYGTLIAQDSPPQTAYLYCGQQWDADLGMYYLRARYYKPDIGRFWTMDTYEGNRNEPLSLHKYLYCEANPANGVDPSGNAVYFVWRRLSVTGGAIMYNLGDVGHGYFLFTPTSDPGSADPFANGQSAIDTFSFHPNSWDYRSKGSLANSFGTQAPGRVWEFHPDDTIPSASHDALLITTSAKDQNILRSYIKNWILSNPVGFDIGNPQKDPNNPDHNTIGTSLHKQAPENGAIYYSLGEQNCVWWATVMLKQSGISVPQSAYYAIADVNNGIGAATQVIYNQRSASTANTLPYPPAFSLPPGFSIDAGSLFSASH